MIQRREFIKNVLLAGFAFAPLLTVAEENPYSAWKPVDPETDPTAMALNYHEDASDAPRVQVGRPGAQPNKQFCYNCQFAHDVREGRFPCSLFPAKTVAHDGWCISWTLRTLSAG